MKSIIILAAFILLPGCANNFEDIRNGDISSLISKIEKGNIDFQEINKEDSSTLLIAAAKNNRSEIVSILLQQRAEPNINHIDKNGFSALYYAAINNQQKTIELLLNSGADTKALPDLMDKLVACDCANKETFNRLAAHIEKISPAMFQAAIYSGNTHIVDAYLNHDNNLITENQDDIDINKTSTDVLKLLIEKRMILSKNHLESAIEKDAVDKIKTIIASNSKILDQYLKDIDTHINNDADPLKWYHRLRNLKYVASGVNEKSSSDIGEALKRNFSIIYFVGHVPTIHKDEIINIAINKELKSEKTRSYPPYSINTITVHEAVDYEKPKGLAETKYTNEVMLQGLPVHADKEGFFVGYDIAYKQTLPPNISNYYKIHSVSYMFDKKKSEIKTYDSRDIRKKELPDIANMTKMPSSFEEIDERINGKIIGTETTEKTEKAISYKIRILTLGAVGECVCANTLSRIYFCPINTITINDQDLFGDTFKYSIEYSHACDNNKYDDVIKQFSTTIEKGAF